MVNARDEIFSILAEIAGIEASALRREMHLAGDLGLDSPKGLQLLCQIEERLGLEIPEEAPPRFETIGDLVEFVEGLAART